MTDHRIILFRGMNTGGVRAPVTEQRAMAEAMGLKNPRTLLASGNLVVESDRDPADLESAVEDAFEARFGRRIAAIVRTPEQWRALIQANPFAAEAADAPSRVLLLLTRDPVPPAAIDAIRAYAVDGERVEAVSAGGGAVVFWFSNGMGGSRMAERPVGPGVVTGRNWNTVLKLAAMVGLEIEA
ncbi:hypothetical protein ASG17_01930 [Brevundimonas sp. Leaf363]|uniref:DUF1697 domain-containing protein n=1 Tax=Brevundimonas sp. Leaf363 TaxID=1736353 RepID=UPI0006FCA912|nr:DUF1697 domain-containing protein [Brevundimonas sp. Leaf363]KQS57500.1 hypothetical protein ASG17_01930 [Brevundimonas sp. Leaf363]